MRLVVEDFSVFRFSSAKRVAAKEDFIVASRRALYQSAPSSQVRRTGMIFRILRLEITGIKVSHSGGDHKWKLRVRKSTRPPCLVRVRLSNFRQAIST